MKYLINKLLQECEEFSADQCNEQRIAAATELVEYGNRLVEIEQILGKAIGYPWFKDDQKNFPGATESDGVCIGEHVTETLADEASTYIKILHAALEESVKLQSHYASLLNMYDDGSRMMFDSADEWIKRLVECGKINK